MEKEVCKIKTLKNVTYPEARKMVMPTIMPSTNNRPSYAAVMKTSKTVGTQTDITNCKCTVIIDKKQSIPITAQTQTESGQSGDEEGWTEVGRSRAQSVSPRGAAAGRAGGGERVGQPPDHQVVTGHGQSKPPDRKSGSSQPQQKAQKQLRLSAGSTEGRVTPDRPGHSSRPRQKIDYP